MNKRSAFFSFHFANDAWRVAQVRNMKVIEGNNSLVDNEWEALCSSGEQAIKRWIEEQLADKSCTVVLIGSQTAGRKWIKYEIKRSWELGKGVVGIYIHNLLDNNRKQSSKGKNPFDFDNFVYTNNNRKLSQIVECYDPPCSLSKNVYDYIQSNIADWVEEAIKIRRSVVSY